MNFSDKEISLMKDVDFLMAKATILEKVKSIFAETQALLQNQIDPSLTINLLYQPGKISRGENYRQLPYVVLDYPAVFSRENIFTFRTLFWWGHFFSATLHLQGTHMDIFRPKMIDHFDRLLDQNIFVCIGNTPWEHHYGADNYALLAKEHITHLQQHKFIKLSKKYPLEDWQILPQKVVDYFTFLQEVIL